jgi:hypothetical protein
LRECESGSQKKFTFKTIDSFGKGNENSTDFSQVEEVLTGFNQTSPLNSTDQITFELGTPNFEVIFPDELLQDESATVSCIMEVSTFSDTHCQRFVEDDACAIAY